jgi:hypothetical protein
MPRRNVPTPATAWVHFMGALLMRDRVISVIGAAECADRALEQYKKRFLTKKEMTNDDPDDSERLSGKELP